MRHSLLRSRRVLEVVSACLISFQSLLAQTPESVVILPGSGSAAAAASRLQSILAPPVIGYGSAFGGPGADGLSVATVITRQELDRLPDLSPDLSTILCAGGKFSSALPGLRGAGKTDAIVGCVREIDGVPVFADQFGSPEDDDVRAISYRAGAIHVLANVGGPVAEYGLGGGAVLNSYVGKRDCFLKSYDLATGTVVSARYFGTPDDDFCNDLAVDGKNVWIVGSTFGTFQTVNPVQSTPLGNGDGFVAALSWDLGQVRALSYLSSNALDFPTSITVADSRTWPQNRWGEGTWKVAVGGVLDGDGFPTTPDAFQRNHVSLYDTYVQVLGYEREDLSQGLKLNYSSIYGGGDMDVLVDARWDATKGGLATLWQTRSGDINTLGRTYNGADDGIFTYYAGPGIPPEKFYVGLSTTLNRPYSLRQDPRGTWVIGGRMTYPDAGPSWQLYLDASRRPITNLLSGFSGVEAWYADSYPWPMWTSAVGTTFGDIRVTDNAYQPAVADPPDGYLQCMRRPYTTLQYVNTTDIDWTLQLDGHFNLSAPSFKASGPVDLSWTEHTYVASEGIGQLSGNLDLTAQAAYTWVLPQKDPPDLRVVHSYDVQNVFADPFLSANERVFGVINLTTQPLRLELSEPTPEHTLIRTVAEALAPGESSAMKSAPDLNLDITYNDSPRSFRLGYSVNFAAPAKTASDGGPAQWLPWVIVVEESAGKTAADLVVRAFDADGNPLETPEVTAVAEAMVPDQSFALEVYPNPTSGPTSIRIVNSHTDPVTAEVFDLFGRRVRTLVDAPLKPGSQTIEWDGRGERGERLAPGTYFVRLRTQSHVLTRSLVVTR